MNATDLLFSIGIICGIVAALFFVWHSIARDLAERAGDWTHERRHRKEHVNTKRRMYQEMINLQIRRMINTPLDLDFAADLDAEWELHGLLYDYRRLTRG